LGPCAFEDIVNQHEVGGEIAAFVCGGVDRPTLFVLIGIEDVASSPSGVLGFVGAVEPVAALVRAPPATCC
jgi:hypothetical protein